MTLFWWGAVRRLAVSLRPLSPPLSCQCCVHMATIQSAAKVTIARRSLLQVIPSTNGTIASLVREKSTKKSKSNKAVDAFIEDILDDEEGEDIQVVDIQSSKLNKFLNSKSAGGGKKGTKGQIPKMNYNHFNEVVQGEKLWLEMEKCVERLKTFYIQQLTVRSVTSLDELPVELEGDIYPLNELASISKKDPKRLIIDSSAFPQAAKNIMTAISKSGMNLNPQQDNLTIFVPIPKVTKEHRESLVNGAKRKLIECKNELKNIQNKYKRKVSDDELADEVDKENATAASETIRQISEHWQTNADQMLATKTKELLQK